MSEHPIQGLMKTAMDSIKGMVDVNTIVGDPVEASDGSMIIPISRVSFGFAAGGTEHSLAESDATEERDLPFGGGSGAGVTVQPIGFLVVGQGTVRMLPVDGNAIYDRLIELAPEVFDRLQNMCRASRMP